MIPITKDYEKFSRYYHDEFLMNLQQKNIKYNPAEPKTFPVSGNLTIDPKIYNLIKDSKIYYNYEDEI